MMKIAHGAWFLNIEKDFKEAHLTEEAKQLKWSEGAGDVPLNW